MTISVLAGGTGSIKLVRGLAATAKKQEIVVICNVGDNIWMHGLYICPDIDTITYGLANMLDQKRGWGIKDESFQCLAQMKKIGAPTWFALGDKDLAMHLLRTSMMVKDGNTLSEVTDFFRNCYCIRAKLIPATDQEISTRILTRTKGDMHLQEFWVKYKGRPTVTGVRYNNANNAMANAAAIDAIKRSRVIVIAPANPISSIGPIVALSDLRKELVQNRDKVIAISPLIGKRALSGPAIKYMKALRFQNSSIGVARYYHDFVSKFIISVEDHSMKLQIEALNMHVYETNITMKTKRDEVRLGKHILKLMEKKIKTTMKTFAIVPIKKFQNTKTRLSSVLAIDDRIHLSLLMVKDTLQVLSIVQPISQIVTVSADKHVGEIALKYGSTFLLEEREQGVNSAVALATNYCIKQAADASLVIPHDLPLLDSNDILKACWLAENNSRCIVICPSIRHDGTNMLLRKPPSIIPTYYDADSYNMHIRAATSLGIPVKCLHSKSVMYDIDTPEDALDIIKEEEKTSVTHSSIEFIKSKF